MNNKIIEDLVELGIYNSKTLSEDDYNKLSKEKTNNSLMYITGRYEGGNENYNKYFKEINTNGFTEEDIKLQLEIDKTKNIRFIKSMVAFFVVLTIVGIIIMFFGGMSLMDTLS